MDSWEKIAELRALIKKQLTPLVTNNYRYLTMCDHPNVGDTLIMAGEFEFFKTLKYKCQEYTTIVSFQNRKARIPKDELLIMRGSGSFGDIWPTSPEFWKYVMRNYQENPILLMPQTIYFDDEDNLKDMQDAIYKHGKVTITVRDQQSYDFAIQHFDCPCYLVPDMAFFMNPKDYQIPYEQKLNKILIVKRDDKEKKAFTLEEDSLKECDCYVSDWPTMYKRGRIERAKNFLLHHRYYRFYDLYIRHIYSRYIIWWGGHFIAPYAEIYATRMHAGILAMMMDKKVHFVDNSYGKLGRVFNTWLRDVDNVCLLE